MSAFWDLYAASAVEPHHKNLQEVTERHEKILDVFTKHDLDALIQFMKEQFADARYHSVVSLMNSVDKVGVQGIGMGVSQNNGIRLRGSGRLV